MKRRSWLQDVPSQQKIIWDHQCCTKCLNSWATMLQDNLSDGFQDNYVHTYVRTYTVVLWIIYLAWFWIEYLCASGGVGNFLKLILNRILATIVLEQSTRRILNRMFVYLVWRWQFFWMGFWIDYWKYDSVRTYVFVLFESVSHYHTPLGASAQVTINNWN
jgi:hypothetical protein